MKSGRRLPRAIRLPRVPCGRGVSILALFGLSLSGCGNVLYTARANAASARLEQARQAGAEERALYEYTLAREHLAKAMTEASEADYGDAYELAGLAREYADQALEKTKTGSAFIETSATRPQATSPAMSVSVTDSRQAPVSPTEAEPSE